nr:hypothetical protein [Tanacetum cinerariifolium]
MSTKLPQPSIELAKKLDDKIPKTVDEMFDRVRAFIQEEEAVQENLEGAWGHALPTQEEKQERALSRIQEVMKDPFENRSDKPFVFELSDPSTSESSYDRRLPSLKDLCGRGKFIKDHVLGRNIPPHRVDRSQGNNGRVRKEQNRTAGVCHSEIPLSLQSHSGKDEDVEP